jgi:hypothetical protein
VTESCGSGPSPPLSSSCSLMPELDPELDHKSRSATAASHQACGSAKNLLRSASAAVPCVAAAGSGSSGQRLGERWERRRRTAALLLVPGDCSCACVSPDVALALVTTVLFFFDEPFTTVAATPASPSRNLNLGPKPLQSMPRDVHFRQLGCKPSQLIRRCEHS